MQQFLRGVDWGRARLSSDDLPPGTGDVQLSLGTIDADHGAWCNTRPEYRWKTRAGREHVRAGARADARVSREHELPDRAGSGERIDVFGEAAASARPSRWDYVLGEIALDPEVRAAGDRGNL